MSKTCFALFRKFCCEIHRKKSALQSKFTKKELRWSYFLGNFPNYQNRFPEKNLQKPFKMMSENF